MVFTQLSILKMLVSLGFIKSCFKLFLFDDFRERTAMFDHTVWGALSPPHTSRALGFTTQDHALARESNAAQGNTQDMEAT